MREVRITIKQADWHRNGIAGVGFYAVLFEEAEQGLMVASLFDEPGYCAVYSIPKLTSDGVTFGRNSWRGDVYEDAIRKALPAFLESQGTNRLGPFSMIPAAAFVKP